MSLNLEEYVAKLQTELASLQAQTKLVHEQIEEQAQIAQENIQKIPEQIRSSELHLESPLDVHLEIGELKVNPILIEQTLLGMYKINTK
jgi:lipid II:glycine glycyltransferase (peptidoglycan interpeptide bridge formation enzyme)